MKYLLTFVAISALVSGCLVFDYPVLTDTGHGMQYRNVTVYQEGVHVSSSWVVYLPQFRSTDGNIPHGGYQSLIIDQWDWRDGTHDTRNVWSCAPMGFGFMGVTWPQNYNMRRPLRKQEMKYYNLIVLSSTWSVTTPRLCDATTVNVDPPGMSNSAHWNGWDWNGPYAQANINDECEVHKGPGGAFGSGFGVIVSQGGRGTEYGAFPGQRNPGVHNIPKFLTTADNVVSNSFELTPFERIAILNELTQNAVFKDGIWHYTIKGDDVTIAFSNRENSFEAKLDGLNLNVQITEDLKGVGIETETGNFNRVMNSIADAREKVSSDYAVFAKWKNVGRVFTSDVMKVAPADLLRTQTQAIAR